MLDYLILFYNNFSIQGKNQTKSCQNKIKAIFQQSVNLLASKKALVLIAQKEKFTKEKKSPKSSIPVAFPTKMKMVKPRRHFSKKT